MSKRIICKICKQEKEHKAKGMCNNCYRREGWKRKKKICPRCKRLIPLKAKGYCGGCYNTLFRLQQIKDHNNKKYHNISSELYKRVTKKCIICGFDKVVELHHLDQRRSNNSDDNFVGLCPNHHKMIHLEKYKKEIFKLLKEKGFNPKQREFRKDIKGGY